MGRLPWDINRAYDELRIGNKSYFMAAGREAYVNELASHFPEERENIERWVDLCQKVSQKDLFFNLKIVRPAWLSRLINRFASSSFHVYANKTALEVAQQFTSNKDLQAAMLGRLWWRAYHIHASVLWFSLFFFFLLVALSALIHTPRPPFFPSLIQASTATTASCPPSRASLCTPRWSTTT